jgi:SAM-dependent methyltransferase
MLIEEAKWIGKEIIAICGQEKYKRILNIGSSSLGLRNVSQSHMLEYIFSPLEKMDIEIIHTDIQDAEGVDIVGDLTNQKFIDKLKEDPFDLVLCTNFFEHIENPEPLFQSIVEIIKPSGYLLVSVPYKYPYHPDPIDTMYRPDIKGLIKNFNTLKFIKGDIIEGRRAKILSNGKQYVEKHCYDMLSHDKRLFLISVLRIFLPFYKFKIWKNNLYYFTNLFVKFSVTCVILKNE